jgi:hypothetical protein
MEDRTLLTSFAFPDFSSTAGLTLNGSAAQVGNVLRLVPATADQAGSTFANTALTTTQSFSTHFQFSIHDSTFFNPADGLVFMIQSDPLGLHALGGSGGSLGFGGRPGDADAQIAPSVAVEFDIFSNPPGDPVGPHVALLKNGDVVNYLTPAIPSPSLYGVPQNVWIDYDAPSHTLNVFVDPLSTKPATPLLSATIDIAGIVGPTGFVGFSASTERPLIGPPPAPPPITFAATHDLLTWQFHTQDIQVTPTAGLFTTESGGTDSFNVVLTTPPTANVTIPLSSSDLTEGTVSPSSLTFTPLNWNIPQKVTVTGVDDSIADGPVSYTILTGAAVSADPNFSGEDAADVQVTNFDNDFPPQQAILPLGSLIYDASLKSRIGSPGRVESYSLLIDPGQKVTVVVDPAAADLKPTIQLFRNDSSGPVLIGSATAGAAGQEAVLQTIATDGQLGGIGPGPKTYTIKVGGAAGTTGFYNVQTVLNAAVENENHDGATDNTRATAQSLEPSFLPLNSAVTQVPAAGSPGRGAVLGRTEIATTTVFSADFESGTDGFTVDNSPPLSSYSPGLWHLSTGRGSQPGHSANHSFYYGTGEGPDGGGNYNTFDPTFFFPTANTGTITSPSIALPGQGILNIDFNYVLQTEGSSFFDSAQLQVKPVTGTNWTTLATYNGVAESSTWKTATPVDVSSFAGQTVQFRWSFDTRDSIFNSFEGWYVDDVRIRQFAPTPDYYAFSLQAGDSATLGLKGLSAGDLTLALENASGTTLALGRTGATNVDEVIDNFVAATAGTYYVRVSGSNLAGTDYSLVVTRNADFDTENNDNIASAQSLVSSQAAGRRWVLGQIAPATSILYGSSRFGQLFTIDVNTGAGMLVGQLPIGTTEIEIDNLSGRAFAQAPDGSFFGQEFDITTGAGIGGPIFDGGSFTGLEYVGATLYGTAIFGPRGESQLRTLDPQTGVSALIGPTGTGPISGLAYNAATHVMYGITGGPGPGDLLTLNLTTRAATVVGPTGFQAGSLEFGPDGALYGGGTGISSGQLYRIDPATGASTPVGPTGFPLITGLALRNKPAGSDFYAVTLTAAQPLDVETSTPADGTGEFINRLDPMIRLYDSAGHLVASDDNSAPDRRNAHLKFNVPKGKEGTYYIEVTASNATADPTGGEYLLDLKGSTGALPPFQVTGTDLPDGARLRFAPPTITVNFNDNLLLTTVQASDLTVNGVAATAVSIVDADTVRFTLPSGLGDGTYTVAIAAGAIQDVQATPLTAFTEHFTLDQTPPRVVSSSIQENDVLPAGTLTYTVTFSEPMNTANLDPSDFQLVGHIRNSSFFPSSFPSYDPTGTTLTITYSGLPDDAYTLTLISCDGAFEDVVGNNLDGEPLAFPIPPNVSGDGVEGGNFAVDFALDAGTQPLPTPLVPVAPPGSLIYQPPPLPATGTIAFAGDTDDFTIALDPGQTLAVLVDGSAGLQPTVAVLDPSNMPIGVAGTAPAVNGQAVFQAAAAPGGGTYTVRVGGAGGTEGLYFVRVIVNAAVENESHGGPTNNDRMSAQPLDASFIDLGLGISRGAVLGTYTPSSLIVNGSFETGDFTGWTTNVTGSPFVPWLVSPAGAGSGFFAPTSPQDGTFDAWNGFDGAGPLEFTMSQDVTLPAGATAVTLSWNDRVQWNFFTATLPRTYDVEALNPATNAVLATVYSFSTGNPATNPFGDTGWQAHTADLSAFAGATIRLQFHEFIPETFTGPGQIEFDAINISATPSAAEADVYSFALSAGQSATVALTALAGSGAHLDILDGTGMVLATGVAGATNLDAAISNFLAPTSGTYYARITGASTEVYSLVVTRSAAFDTEPNDSFASAQDISGPRAALGDINVLGPQTLTFDELPFQPVDGLHFKGVTFDFKVGGVDSTAASYGSFSFLGQTTFTSDPSLVGTTLGVLTLDFDRPVSAFNFGVALAAPFATVPSAANVTLYDASAGLVGNFSVDVTPGFFVYPSGQFSYSGTPVTRAVITFNSVFASTFVLDNLTFVPVADEDWYSIGVNAGDNLVFSTRTPADGAGEFVNLLDPHIELYDPSGALVASGTPLADGRNEQITYKALTAGRYRIRVVSQNGVAGEYVLSQGIFPAAPATPGPTSPITTIAVDASATPIALASSSVGSKPIVTPLPADPEAAYDQAIAELILGPVDDATVDDLSVTLLGTKKGAFRTHPR